MKLTRRQFGTAAAASLVAMNVSQPARSALPLTDIPRGAIDCHNHIIGPQDKFPYSPTRNFTPPEAVVADLKDLRTRLGISRNVLIQPNVYGTDNRCLVDALDQLGNSARGIVVLPVDVTDEELRRLDASGVRGVRINLGANAARDPKIVTATYSAFAPRCAALGWHIETFGSLAAIVALAPVLGNLSVPLVLDHFAGAAGDGGVNQKGFAALLELVRARNTYVKLSAPYNRSKQAGYADMVPLARALIEVGPDRTIWGTDWPHPDLIPGRPISELTPYQNIDNELLMRIFADWCPDAATRKSILVDTPQRLYRFL